jgi:hypothetical protein
LVFQQARLRAFVIRFRAGALPFFTPRPLAELIDHFTPLPPQWDRTAAQQLTALHHSPYFEEQCLQAERLLLSRLAAGNRSEAVL